MHCNMDTHPMSLVPARPDIFRRNQETLSKYSDARRWSKNSGPLNFQYSGYKLNSMLFRERHNTVQNVLSLKSQLLYQLMHEERNFASETSMHHDENDSRSFYGNERSTRPHLPPPPPTNVTVTSSRFRKEILCNIPFVSVDTSFPGIVHHGVYRVLPARKLDSQISSLTSAISKKTGQGASCGLVSSADSIIGSMNGKSIDAHDIILRLKDALVENETTMSDTGSRTTIRVLNSHFFTSNEFSILQIVRDASLLLIWDNFTFNSEPDATLLYQKYVNYRDRYPEVQMYILNPILIRYVVQILQNSSSALLPARIEPSSDLIGLLLLVRFCSRITAYEFIPSIRISDHCLYADPIQTMNNCSFMGIRSSEILLAWRMNHASDYSVIVQGKSEYSGCNLKWYNYDEISFSINVIV